MKKIWILFFIPVCILFAQEPDSDFLMQFGEASGDFISYEGPHASIDSAEAIRNIGRILSREGNYAGKYTSFRLFTLDDSFYSAHLIIPEAESTVDHIKNLRRIIAGYLEEEFSYSIEQADTLAVFITFYNAVYYQDVEHFTELYSESSASFLDPGICGLPFHFEQWPGGSQIVIPLRKKIMEEGNEIDAVELTDDAVTSRMQKEPEKMIEERQDMAEFRQEQLEEDQQLIEDAIESGTASEEEINQAEEIFESDQQDIIEDRDSIADDQNEMIRTEEEPAVEEKGKTVHFIITQYSDDQLVYGQMVNFDSLSGTIFIRSVINTIRSGNFIKSDNSLIVIAGKEGENTTVKLIALDPETLEVTGESRESLAPRSPLIEKNGLIYAIYKEESGWYLGQFSADLELLNTSEIAIVSGSAVMANGEYIYVQESEDRVERLNISNLKISK